MEIITFDEYIKAIQLIKNYHKQQKSNYISITDTYISDMNLNARLYNSLYNYFYEIDKNASLNSIQIHELSNIDLNKFRKLRGVGYRTYKELEEIINDYKKIIR